MSDDKSHREESLEKDRDLAAQSIKVQELLKRLLDETAKIIAKTKKLVSELEDKRKRKKSDQ